MTTLPPAAAVMAELILAPKSPPENWLAFWTLLMVLAVVALPRVMALPLSVIDESPRV